jgi:hypothetical protein
MTLDEQMRFNICADLHLPRKANKRVRLHSSSTYLIVEVERDKPHKGYKSQKMVSMSQFLS